MLARSKYLLITSDIIIPIISLLIFGFLVWIVFFSSIFQVNQVICLYDYKPCENENLLVEADRLKGTNIFWFQPEEFEQLVLQGDYLVREVNVTKELPQTLTISLFSVYPTVALQLDRVEDKWVVFDHTLRVIKIVEQEPNVPLVIVKSLDPVHLGQKLTITSYNLALAFVQELSRSSLGLTTLYLVDENTFAVYLEGGAQALLTPERESSTQIYTLQAILQDDTIKKDSRTILDLRFSKPIIRQN
jgi:hypothetical protein